MRVGIVLVPEERWRDAGAKWRAVEELGFDHGWTFDHLGWKEFIDGPWFSAMPTLTAAGAITERIGLGVWVATPNFRHPVSFAREVLTLDDVSGGRLLLGLGAGTPLPESYDNAVFDREPLTPRQRADRYAEFVAALDGLLSTDRYDHEGEYYRAVGARNVPGCVQQPRVPLLLAASGPRTIRLAAEHGDGWCTVGVPADDADGWWRSVVELTARFDEALATAGRAGVPRYLSLDSSSPLRPTSSVQAFADAAGRAAELGFTDILMHWPRAEGRFAGRRDVLDQIAADVLPTLR